MSSGASSPTGATTPRLDTDSPTDPEAAGSPQSSNPSTLPSSTLDHASYPHILDGILAHADPPTLLMLSHTSRSVRARVQPHLYRHILLCADPEDGCRVVHLPCAPWRVLSICPQPEDRKARHRQWCGEAPLPLHNTVCLDLGSVSRWHAAWLPLPALRMVRTSLSGHRDIPVWPLWPPPRPRQVTVRSTIGADEESWGETSIPATYLSFDKWESVRSRIFVTHMDLLTWPPQPAWLYDLEYSDEEEGSSYHASRPSAVLQVSMAVDTARLILHLHWSGSLRAGTDVQILPQELEMHADVVVVLHPHASTNPDKEGESGGDDGWFTTLLQHLVKIAVQRRARVFIVGVEGCTDADLGLRRRPRPIAKWQRALTECPPIRRGEEVVAAVARLMDATFEHAWCDVTGVQMDACRAMWAAEGDVEGLSEQIRLLSLDEWERTADPLEVAPVSMPTDHEVVRARKTWHQRL